MHYNALTFSLNSLSILKYNHEYPRCRPLEIMNIHPDKKKMSDILIIPIVCLLLSLKNTSTIQCYQFCYKKLTKLHTWPAVSTICKRYSWPCTFIDRVKAEIIFHFYIFYKYYFHQKGFWRQCISILTIFYCWVIWINELVFNKLYGDWWFAWSNINKVISRVHNTAIWY